MKKFVLFFIAFILLISLVGCSYTGGTVYSDPAIGLIPIPNRECLYYDPTEKVVYIMYYEHVDYWGYGYMSPYYAQNGLPYLYDANTQTLVQIGG